MASQRWRLVLVLLAGVFSGCESMPHSMQPSQLWKMNRQQPWDEGSFSVADPVDPRLATDASDSGWTATRPSADER